MSKRRERKGASEQKRPVSSVPCPSLMLWLRYEYKCNTQSFTWRWYLWPHHQYGDDGFYAWLCVRARVYVCILYTKYHLHGIKHTLHIYDDDDFSVDTHVRFPAHTHIHSTHLRSPLPSLLYLPRSSSCSYFVHIQLVQMNMMFYFILFLALYSSFPQQRIKHSFDAKYAHKRFSTFFLSTNKLKQMQLRCECEVTSTNEIE